MAKHCLATDFVPRETVNIQQKHVGLPIGASCHGNTRPPSPQKRNQIIYVWSLAATRGRLELPGEPLIAVVVVAVYVCLSV